MLTGSWPLGQHFEDYMGNGSPLEKPSWLYYAVGAQDGVAIDAADAFGGQKSSWTLDFRGTTKTQVMTMFANAPKGMINHSNNPTYTKYGQASQITGSNYYIEDPSAEIQNTISSSFHDEEPSFKKETHISKIGIYDDNMNLLAIAKVATPVRKTEERDLTFKLKLDI